MLIQDSTFWYLFCQAADYGSKFPQKGLSCGVCSFVLVNVGHLKNLPVLFWQHIMTLNCFSSISPLSFFKKLSKWHFSLYHLPSCLELCLPIYDLISLTVLLQISFRFRIVLCGFLSKEKTLAVWLYYHSFVPECKFCVIIKWPPLIL